LLTDTRNARIFKDMEGAPANHRSGGTGDRKESRMNGTDKQIAWANDILADAKVWFDVSEEFIAKKDQERQEHERNLSTADADDLVKRYTRRAEKAAHQAQAMRKATERLAQIIDDGNAAFIIENRDVIGMPHWFRHDTFRDINTAVSFAEKIAEI
jgi:hypothetical protein